MDHLFGGRTAHGQLNVVRRNTAGFLCRDDQLPKGLITGSVSSVGRREDFR